MRREILIAHYDKSLSWVEELNTDANIIIYSTNKNMTNEVINGIKINVISPNKGMDSIMYLTYIINNYKNLPDQILFVHHHRDDWSQPFSLPFIINNLNWDCEKYFNIGNRNYYDDPYNLEKWVYIKLNEFWYLFNDYIPFPEKIMYYAGTQFKVDKDLILQYPIDFYEKLKEWVINTNCPDYISGRVFEYTWHYILTKCPIDKIIDIKKLLT